MTASLALSPFYIAYLSTIWSDLIGVHFAIFFLLWLDAQKPNREVFLLACALGIAVATYIRAIYPGLIALLAAFLLLRAVHRNGQISLASLATPFITATLIALAVVGLLLPWSINVSSVYGPTLTITTPKISKAYWCSDPAWNSRLPADSERIKWQDLSEQIKQRARKAERSFHEQALMDTHLACRGISLEDKLRTKAWSIEGFFMYPTEFIQRFINLRCRNISNCLSEGTSNLIIKLTRFGWFALCLVGLLLLFAPFGRSPSGSYLLPLHLKGLAFLLCVHPLIALGHGRYYVQLVPIIALAVGVIFGEKPPLVKLESRPNFHNALLLIGQALPLFLLIASIWIVTRWG